MKLSKNKILKLLKGKNKTVKLRKKKPVKKKRKSVRKRHRTARNGRKKNQRAKTMKRMYGGAAMKNGKLVSNVKATGKGKKKTKPKPGVENTTYNPLLTEVQEERKKKRLERLERKNQGLENESVSVKTRVKNIEEKIGPETKIPTPAAAKAAEKAYAERAAAKAAAAKAAAAKAAAAKPAAATTLAATAKPATAKPAPATTLAATAKPATAKPATAKAAAAKAAAATTLAATAKPATAKAAAAKPAASDSQKGKQCNLLRNKNEIDKKVKECVDNPKGISRKKYLELSKEVHPDKNTSCEEEAKEYFQNMKSVCSPEEKKNTKPYAINDVGFTKDNVLNVGASLFKTTADVKLPDPPVGKTWSKDYPIIINLTPVNCKNDQFKPTEPPFTLKRYNSTNFCPDVFKLQSINYQEGIATIGGFELDGKTPKKWGQNLVLAYSHPKDPTDTPLILPEAPTDTPLILPEAPTDTPAADAADTADATPADATPATGATGAADATGATGAADATGATGTSAASAADATGNTGASAASAADATGNTGATSDTGANANDEDNSAEETKNEESSAISLKDGAKITVTFHIKGGKVVPSVDGQGPSLEELLTVTQGQKGGKKKKSRKHKKLKNISKKVHKTKRRNQRK